MPRGGVEQKNYGLLCSKVADLVLPNISDRWCWSLEGSQESSVKSSRILIDNTILPKAEVPTGWLRVVPIKVNVHAWRVCLDKLPTRANFSLRGMDIPSIACPLCSLGDRAKRQRSKSMYKQALEVWPNANVKFNYLEKLLSSIPPTQSKDPSTALAQDLDVMNRVLEKQPHLFIRNNIIHITQILKPCFKYKMLDAGKSLCSLLKMVFVSFPSEAASTPQDVKSLYQKKNVIDPFSLVRVLQRLARDLASTPGSFARQGQRTDPDFVVSSSHQGAAVGVLISNLKSLMKLIGERIRFDLPRAAEYYKEETADGFKDKEIYELFSRVHATFRVIHARLSSIGHLQKGSVLVDIP
nr:phosphatidylinositol 3- and 4-kinase family protein with FAT domain isoform 1 [Tanacetum cinerariifolium]